MQRARAIFKGLCELAVCDFAVRDEHDWIEPGRARIGSHGSRRVARGDAGNALPAKTSRLRDAAGHTVVLKRSGGVEALVLESQVIQPTVFRGARGFQKRRVALAQ